MRFCKNQNLRLRYVWGVIEPLVEDKGEYGLLGESVKTVDNGVAF